MLYQSLKFIFQILFRTFYTYNVEGKEHLPKSATIIAPNHASFLDPPLVSLAHPNPMHFFARKTLFKNKIFSYLLSKVNAHPIASGAEGMRALAFAKKLLNNNEMVVLFPEGTRSKDGTLLPLRKGVISLAIKSQVSITPMYIKGAYEIWPRGSTFPKLRGKVTCTYGKPLNPKNYLHLSSQEATESMLEDLRNSLLSMQNNQNTTKTK
jgi:1-acyl-sn-glycerol-3-phosphate acyltransferase